MNIYYEILLNYFTSRDPTVPNIFLTRLDLKSCWFTPKQPAQSPSGPHGQSSLFLGTWYNFSSRPCFPGDVQNLRSRSKE